MKYHSEFYNKVNNKEQWIRLSDGCYNNCSFCYCPKHKISYKLPKIKRNIVRFLDMNFLYAYDDKEILLEQLRTTKVNGKVVRYTFTCGLDYRLLNLPILKLLRKARIGRVNNKGRWRNGLVIAWDNKYKEKFRITQCIDNMIKAGYDRSKIAVFMVCNHKVSYKECLNKLKVLKKYRIQIIDCWFNNQIRGKVKPIFWTFNECKTFGGLCRSHNVAIIQYQYDSMDILYK